MSEEATKLEEKATEPLVDTVKTDENKPDIALDKSKTSKQEMSTLLAYLILFSLPFGYIVSSLHGQYATHATFAMVALFIICSLSDKDKISRYTGFLFALLWTCAGIMFYSMRGI